MKIRLIIPSIAFWLYTLLSASQCLANEHGIALSYTRLAVDEKGASYFVDESKQWNAWPSNLAMTTLTENSDSVRFFRAKPGWKMLELHYAPKRQYLLVLNGVLQIQASSGETRQFGQGSILLVEDTYGQGHRTKNAGDDDLILVWVGNTGEVN